MKSFISVILALLFVLNFSVSFASEEELPPAGRTALAEINSLKALAKKHKSHFVKNVNTLQNQLESIEMYNVFTVDGEKILTFSPDVINLMLKHFTGFCYSREGEIKVEWSADLKEWKAPGVWWSSTSGSEGRYKCGFSNNPLYLKFSGQGKIRNFTWKTTSPIILEFDPEPYLVPAANLPILEVKTTVLATKKMAFSGESDFDRRKWMRVYNMPDSIKTKDYKQASKYFVSCGFTASRDAGFRMSDKSNMTAARKSALLKDLRHFYPDPPASVFCFSKIPENLQCRDSELGNAKSCPDPSRFKETAELCAATIALRERELGEYAGFYCEVKNESDIGTNWGFFNNQKKYDAWKLLSEYHNEVARAVKRRNPRWKVGGPSSCLPLFDARDFERGRKILEFTERTYADLDYYTWHFYERNSFRLNPDRSYLFGRMDASFDLYRSHQRRLGGEKPLIITEYGASHSPCNDVGIWNTLRSMNALMVKMMDTPDLIEMSVPFIIPISWWSKSKPEPENNSFQLFVYDKEKKMKRTKVSCLLEHWRDVDGVRVPVKSNHKNVNIAAARSGEKLYVAISNLSGHRIKVALKAVTGDARIKNIDQRRFYIERAELKCHTDKLENLQAVPLAFDETSLLVITLDKSPDFDGELDRKVFCSPEILQPTGRTVKFTIELPEDSLSPSEAVLRLGLWRKGSFPRGGTVKINDHRLAVTGFKPQKTSYFGLRELNIPTALLKKENTVEVHFPDKGGVITSAVFYNTYLKQYRNCK